MKKLLSILLTLAICSAALCLTAAAAHVNDPAPKKVEGQVASWDGDGIYLQKGDEADPNQDVVIHPGEAPVVDAETGLPLDLDTVKDGDTLYAWIGPAATMSLPPQTFPKVIVGNVSEDAAAPEYYELISAGRADGGNMVFSVANGEEQMDLSIPLDAEVTPWLTRQIIRLEGIEAGSQILVWRNGEGVVTKVLVFPYAYRGTASWDAAGNGSVNGEAVSVPGKLVQNKETGETQVYLPLRAMAEAAGYDVLWDRNRGAVVQDENVDLVFFAVPGEEVIFRDGGETGISGPCILENGVTYLPAEDLCYWLNLFFVAD